MSTPAMPGSVVSVKSVAVRAENRMGKAGCFTILLESLNLKILLWTASTEARLPNLMLLSRVSRLK